MESNEAARGGERVVGGTCNESMAAFLSSLVYGFAGTQRGKFFKIVAPHIDRKLKPGASVIPAPTFLNWLKACPFVLIKTPNTVWAVIALLMHFYVPFDLSPGGAAAAAPLSLKFFAQRLPLWLAVWGGYTGCAGRARPLSSSARSARSARSYSRRLATLWQVLARHALLAALGGAADDRQPRVELPQAVPQPLLEHLGRPDLDRLRERLRVPMGHGTALLSERRRDQQRCSTLPMVGSRPSWKRAEYEVVRDAGRRPGVSSCIEQVCERANAVCFWRARGGPRRAFSEDALFGPVRARLRWERSYNCALPRRSHLLSEAV